MHSAVVPIIQFLLRNAFQLVIIAVILVAGKEALEQWRSLPAAQADYAVLQSSAIAVQDLREKAIVATLARVDRIRNAPIALLDARIAEVDSSRRAIELANQAPILKLPLGELNRMQERIIGYFRRAMEAELLRQENIYLVELRRIALKAQSRQAGTVRLEQLRLTHVGLYNAVVQARRQIAGEEQDHRILHRVPFTPSRRTLLALEKTEADLVRKALDADKAYREQLAALNMLGPAESTQAFEVDRQRLEVLLAPLQNTVSEAKDIATGNWLSRLLTPVVKAIPAAIGVLVTGFLAHLAVKAFLFYFLAPLATRAAPICLDSSVGGTVKPRVAGKPPGDNAAIKSAVSTEIRLAPGEEMLILHEYVQSSRVSGNKQTKWLLDWSCPWTSLVSGMYALERIRSAPGEVIVVSAGNDPFCEIACVTLPRGSAMVFQPRGLVGVIYDSVTPLKITRRWRLFSLHAWLTLQLRFLVFAGPVTLIVKGNRGVRLEPADRGRTIRQAATLGFSANLRYSTVRCDTFYPFYAGKTALLQDRFEESSGYYVYDETPVGSKRSGKAERGLEGVLDATLKVFGI